MKQPKNNLLYDTVNRLRNKGLTLREVADLVNFSSLNSVRYYLREEKYSKYKGKKKKKPL